MGILSIFLLVLFVINAVLLVLLVLIQNDEGGGLGGMFGGGSNTAFGSRSGNVLTRATTVLGALFLVISLGLALLSRTPSGSGVIDEARRLSVEETGTNWIEDELNPLNNNMQFLDGDYIFDDTVENQ
jgi:preprotein translocase subunit SecG